MGEWESGSLPFPHSPTLPLTHSPTLPDQQQRHSPRRPVASIELLHEQPVVREFAVTLDAPVHKVIERCAAEGVNPGFPLEDDGLLIAITERRTREQIDRLASLVHAEVAA